MEVIRSQPSFFSDVRDISQVGEARRAAISFARASGAGESAFSTVGIIVTELATNIIRHAVGGCLAVQFLSTGRGDFIEVLAMDRGPGMKDIGKCLQDGFTTAGTAGNGLGAVRRLSSEFDIFSIADQGTVILSRVLVGARPEPKTDDAMFWGAYSRPAPGETVCGDICRVSLSGDRMRFMVADGLGHGPDAAQSAELVAEMFTRDPSLAPDQFLAAAHRAVLGKRGAAVAIAELRLSTGIVQYAGVGNISGVLVDGDKPRGLFTHNGTVGVLVRKIQTFEYPWAINGLLIMHSDGLQTRWSIASYPGLQARDPSIIAGVLARDFTRGRDDITVLVAKLGGKRE
jgi:anti-sigma regulatory factor (Ser/Thr protein kinase)